MPHIHELIDFVVGAFLIHQRPNDEPRVLLVHHRKLDVFICPGGHIELDEDTDQALWRELKEETGLTSDDVKWFQPEPFGHMPDPGNDLKELLIPNFVDIHPINPSHRHIGLFYQGWSKTDHVVLASAEHHEIGWYTYREVEQLKMMNSSRHYALMTIRRWGFSMLTMSQPQFLGKGF